jgi:hypothetical protein
MSGSSFSPRYLGALKNPLIIGLYSKKVAPFRRLSMSSQTLRNKEIRIAESALFKIAN